MKKILISIFISFFLVLNLNAETAVSNPLVEYDGFNIMEENHAKIVLSLKTLESSNVSVTGADADKIKIGQYNNWYNKNGDEIIPLSGIALYYEGPITFGTGTGTANNSIDAEIAMRWPKAATLYDGTTADVLMTISDIEFSVRKLSNTSLNENDNYCMLIAFSNNDSSFWFYSQKPQTRALTDKLYTELTDDEKTALTSNSYAGNSYKVNIKLLKEGTNTPIDSKYTSLAFGMSDIDITDRTVYTSGLESDEAKILAQATNGIYNEGIEFISGFNNKIHLANSEPLEEFNITEQSIVKTITGPHQGVKIVVDPIKKANTQIRPDYVDDNTYYSGFVTMATPQDLTFYWTGCNCGSELFSSQDVLIKEKHNADGLVTTTSYGNNIIFERLDQWEETYHPSGSSPLYTYNPKTGYHLVFLKIDNVETQANSDFEYTFNNIFYNPLVRLGTDALTIRDTNGEPTYLSEPHSIEIVYAPNAFLIVYEDGGGTDGIEKMPDEEGKYGEEIVLSENQYKKDDYEFVDWEVYIEDEDGNRIEYKDSTGKQIHLEDKSEIEEVPVPNNGKLVLVATWSITNPKTGVISILDLLVISLIAFGIYKLARKNKTDIIQQ